MSKKTETPKAEEKAEKEVEKKIRVTEQIQEGEGGREPKPGTPKDVIFQAGCQKGGASIQAISEQMGKTTSNTRQHITQCKTVLGFGYRIEGDNYQITGDVAKGMSWEEQMKSREAEAEAKAKAEKAKKDAEAEAKAKAEKDTKAVEAPTGEDFGDFD